MNLLRRRINRKINQRALEGIGRGYREGRRTVVVVRKKKKKGRQGHDGLP